ncbi:MAG: ATP-binding protein [bacterium]
MKYRIFVSGNQKELKKERLSVREIIREHPTLNNVFDVFLFEELPAKSKSPVSTYLEEVAKSDIYLGIFGYKYGEKTRKDNLSGTEREYRYFTELYPKKDILIFIKGKDATKRDEDMQHFLQDIKSRHTYVRFTTNEDFKTKLLKTIISYLDEARLVSKTPFDEGFCRNAEYTDINEEEVKDFLENRTIKHKVDISKISIKDVLVNRIKIIGEENGNFKITNAALLFFGRNPSEFIPQHEIRIARFRGSTRTESIDVQEINGPIYKMLEEVESFFKRNTRLASKIVEFKRVEIPEYPYEVIREAVINAIAHRDYNIREAPIMISIFDDRIEISSPGKLLPGLSIKDLEGKHATRNRILCDIFNRTLDMERFGTGISKMKLFMKNYGLSEPEFMEEGNFFVVKFYGPQDKILDLVSNIPEERYVSLRELGLNERQIEALRLMINEKKILSNKEYAKMFNVTRKTAFRDFKKLEKLGYVKAEGTTRDKRYRAI